MDFTAGLKLSFIRTEAKRPELFLLTLARVIFSDAVFEKGIFQMIKLKAFFTNQSGATAVEYGLIVAMVAAVSMVSIRTVGNRLATHWQSVSTVVPADVAATTASATK